jgi:diguanylate cyclase (GGDEF)-like protein
VTDRVLDGVWNFVQGEKRHGAAASQVNPQRFALLFADPDTQRAANIVERLRQTIAKTHFVHGEHEIRVSVSCGLSDPKPGDDVEGLIARARAALDEAKRYGRDRTFLHRGDFPAPVVPPTLSIEDTRVSV